MASGSLVTNVTLQGHPTQQPSQAYVEKRGVPDLNNLSGNPVTRTWVNYKKDVLNPQTPEFILDGELMTPLYTGAGATGITVLLALAAEIPVAAGNAVFGVSFERMQPSTAGAVINANNWQAEATGTWTAPASPGQVSLLTIAVLQANINSLPGELFRCRIRRLNTNVLDTLVGAVFCVGMQLKET